MNSDTGGRLGNILLQDAGRLAQEAQQFGVYFFRVGPRDAVRTVLHAPARRAPLMSLAVRSPVAVMGRMRSASP